MSPATLIPHYEVIRDPLLGAVEVVKVDSLGSTLVLRVDIRPDPLSFAWEQQCLEAEELAAHLNTHELSTSKGQPRVS